MEYYNIEAEKDILSIVLNDIDVLIENSEKLDKKYFYDPFHQKMINKIKENIVSNIPIEISLLSDNQREQQTLSEIKLRSKSGEYFDVFFNSLEECFVARSLIKVSDTIKKNVEKQKDEISPSKVLYNVRAVIEEISNKKVSSVCVAKDLVDPLIEEFNINREEFLAGISSDRYGIVPTPFNGVNSLLKKRGFRGGNMIIVAARPSIGKTEFALNCAAHAAIKEEKNIFVYSLEMMKESLLERILLYDSQVPSSVLETGTRSDKQWKDILASAEKIKNSNLLFEDNLSADIYDIITSIRKANNKKKLDAVIIDYLQLIQYSGNANTRNDELSAISRAIKQESVRLNIPIIALSQLSRKHIIEGREPQLVDLRDSGAIEQDADVVIFLHATEKEKNNKTQARTKGILAKQREGAIGEFFLLNKKEVQTFVEISEVKYSGPKQEQQVNDGLPF